MEGESGGKQKRVEIRYLYDLGPNDRIYGDCPECHWSGELDMKGLAERFGNVELDWIKARVKCSQCGRKTGRMRQIWTLEPLEGWPPKDDGGR